jgi:micrococcal nuclease
MEAVDGQSFRLESGAVVAYASLRAPDPASNSEAVRAYAQESLNFNRSLVQGRKVRLEWGSMIRSPKGDNLAFVYLEDGALANRRVLEEGYAKLAIEAPNLEHAPELRKAAAEARREHRGLWRFEAKSAAPKVAYIGDAMTKEFHLPECPLLDNVPQGHRREFGSAVDGVAADFRICSKCKRASSQETDLF